MYDGSGVAIAVLDEKLCPHTLGAPGGIHGDYSGYRKMLMFLEVFC